MSDAKFQIRMPPELHQELVESAKANRRSMNAEIVARLAAVKNAETHDLATIAARLRSLEDKVAQLQKKGK